MGMPPRRRAWRARIRPAHARPDERDIGAQLLGADRLRHRRARHRQQRDPRDVRDEGTEGTISPAADGRRDRVLLFDDRAAGGRSEEHTSELQSLMRISYAVFCLKKKNPKLY